MEARGIACPQLRSIGLNRPWRHQQLGLLELFAAMIADDAIGNDLPAYSGHFRRLPRRKLSGTGVAIISVFTEDMLSVNSTACGLSSISSMMPLSATARRFSFVAVKTLPHHRHALSSFGINRFN